GHLGGANTLAKVIAKKLKATEVITTATDLAGLPCIEDIAIKFSLQIETKAMIKKINSAILRGELITVIDSNQKRRLAMKADKKLKKAFIFKSKITKAPTDPLVVVSPERDASEEKAYKNHRELLYLRPKEFVVGIGCRRGVLIKEVKEAYASVLAKANISPLSIRNLSSIDIKADERGLIGFAKKEGLEIDFIKAKELKKIKPPSGTSKSVKRLVGVPGVAEPSALISAGTKKEKAKIWIKKQKFKRVTIALARVPYTS
ncbi:MAG: cobalamin biosynthesis protein, partial [Proteobacteria bacterium]|nr:cobalamin biosynthesis protein [Pseudomonadota bacterium]